MRVGKIVEWLLNLNFSIITTSAFNDSVFERSLETKTFLKKKSSIETGKKRFNQFPFKPRSLLAFFFPLGRLRGKERLWGKGRYCFCETLWF